MIRATITQLPPRRTGIKDADGKELLEAGWYEVELDDDGIRISTSPPIDPRKLSPVKLAHRARGLAS